MLVGTLCRADVNINLLNVVADVENCSSHKNVELVKEQLKVAVVIVLKDFDNEINNLQLTV